MSYQPPAGGPPAAPPNNQMAVGSIIASAIGLLCGIGSIIGIVLGAVGIVLNILWRIVFFN